MALGGVEDHVRLLARLPATPSVAGLVKHVKGAPSHLVTHSLSLAPGDGFKWQGAYGAYSVSPRQVTQVRDSIARQKEHHASGSLVDDWEFAREEEEPLSVAADG